LRADFFGLIGSPVRVESIAARIIDFTCGLFETVFALRDPPVKLLKTLPAFSIEKDSFIASTDFLYAFCH